MQCPLGHLGGRQRLAQQGRSLYLHNTRPSQMGPVQPSENLGNAVIGIPRVSEVGDPLTVQLGRDAAGITKGPRSGKSQVVCTFGRTFRASKMQR